MAGSSPQFLLEVLEGPEPGREIRLHEGDLVVGRASTCSVTLPHGEVAPTHCGLRVRQDQVIIAPGGTVNQVAVNDERLRTAKLLRVGDRLRIGPFVLVLRVSADGDEVRFHAGDQVGKFRLLAELGSGTVGRVFEAIDADGHKVALKTMRLRRDWSHRQVEHRRALFRREARALAAVTHPNVVRSFGMGEHDGIPWLAMEFLEGMTLRERMVGGRLPLARVERMMFQLCGALAAVHDAGIIHRDLKPSNVMLVGPEEAVKVTDFGLAAPQGAPQLDEIDPQQASEAVRIGKQVGTPAYMAPEQTRGGAADMRSDVWSLGAMLYELAAGRRPFPGRDVREVLTAVVRDCPAPLPDDIERHYAGVVYRCLQKRADWRFANAVEMVDTLHERRVVQRLPVGSEGPPRPPLTGCPRCHAPIQHPMHCVKCDLRLFPFTDGQMLTALGAGGKPEACCGVCAAALEPESRKCHICGATFTDQAPERHSFGAPSLASGGTQVIDIFDQALALVDKCPYCSTARNAPDARCRKCGFNLRAYASGRVALELAVGGWAVRCVACGTLTQSPDEQHCSGCGLNFANGMFLDGSRFADEVPASLARKLREGG